MNPQATRIAIIGHRGAGKSSLLARLAAYWDDKQINFIDLDRAIEEAAGKPVAEIFAGEGEASFRARERASFAAIAESPGSFVVAVGGGFPVDDIPADVRCVWAQRATDELGRIFLDRPRLNPELPPLEEFAERARARSPRFLARADEIAALPEGLREPDDVERLLFASEIPGLGGYLPVSSWHLARPALFGKFASAGFELRDDWLDDAQLAAAARFTGESPLIVSARRPGGDVLKFKSSIGSRARADWPLEMGARPPSKEYDVASMHERAPGESLGLALARLERSGARELKAAPLIDGFDELEELLSWQRDDPDGRSALPRSRDGRWAWARLLQKGRQPISFWRDGEAGSALDQPTLYQWLATPSRPAAFAAVLGDPVAHSRTPVEHRAFFAKRGWPAFAIRATKEEAPRAFESLRRLGLRAAAVTSPLKQTAFNWAGVADETAAELRSANAFLIDAGDGSVRCANTDAVGFAQLFAEASRGAPIDFARAETLVWGGGGVLGAVRRACPNAQEYSAREARPRAGNRAVRAPEIVIWAAGPRDPAPPFSSARAVIDLNYREDSAARAYAAKVGALYFSGLTMFLAQAQAQREFFK